MTSSRAMPRPPHLVVVAANPLRIGGMQTFTRFLVRTACAAGWRVTVALSGEDIYKGIGGQLAVQRVDWVDADLGGDRRYRLPVIIERRRWFRRVRPDVALFVQSSNAPFRASVAGAALAGVPVVVTHRTMPWVRDFVPIRRHVWGLLPGMGLHNHRQIVKTRFTALLADRIVYNSRLVREEYENVYGYPRHKGCVIVNAAPAMEAPRDGNAPNERVTIGYLGRLADEKRVDVLIRALAAMRHAGGARLLIFGDGPLRESLAGLADESGLGGRVEFRGSVTDIAAAYAEIDIVAVCSRREASSNTALEAMAAGKAVVVSDAGGLPELVDQGRAGVCVPAGDVAALAAALDRLVSDAGERRRLGEAARAVVHQRHDAGRVGQQWLNLLDVVAARRTGRPAVLSRGLMIEPMASPG